MLQSGHRATEPRSISEALSHFLSRSLSRSPRLQLTKDKSRQSSLGCQGKVRQPGSHLHLLRSDPIIAVVCVRL